MIEFIKGIFYDQVLRVEKMWEKLQSPDISKDIDAGFLFLTLDKLIELAAEIKRLIASGDLEIESLAQNNIIRYNTFHERLLTLELFRYLIILGYGKPEEYFKKKIQRIYTEINCFQTPPIITTISNSQNYYWALPSYNIIAVPSGEERNLLNLPDLFHEMGHLIYNQHELFLKGTIEDIITDFYQKEQQRIIFEQRPAALKDFYIEKQSWWLSSWIMEFTCDLIATYLVGPAYGWTNLKLTTLSGGKNRIYQDHPSHPSDESRMRAIFFILRKMGHTSEVERIEKSWGQFLTATRNPKPPNYNYIFPQHIIEALANFVYDGCKLIDLTIYGEQVIKYANPVSKMLNDAWELIFTSPDTFQDWEKARILEIGE